MFLKEVIEREKGFIETGSVVVEINTTLGSVKCSNPIAYTMTNFFFCEEKAHKGKIENTKFDGFEMGSGCIIYSRYNTTRNINLLPRRKLRVH